MIVYAAKVSARKILAGVCVLGAVVLGIRALLPSAASESVLTTGDSIPTAATGELAVKCKTNEQRVALLESYGWKVDPTPRSEREVQIPKTFDENYQRYNAIQLAQGLDLIPYQGKRATLYTYELLEYPSGAEGVTANLLLRRNRVIAADISAAESDGFVHGITEQPNASSGGAATVPSTSDTLDDATQDTAAS